MKGSHDDTDSLSQPDGGTWHHVHPLSPLLRTILISLAVIAGAIANSHEFIREQVEAYFTHSESSGIWLLTWLRDHPLLALAIVGGLVLVIGLIAALNWLGWKYMMYKLDDEGVYLRSGVIGKKHRSARLDRVQAIDVNQPLMARLVGLATLTFDVAGGKGSNITIGYLRRGQALALRDAMLARVRAAKQGGGAGAVTNPQADEAATGTPATSPSPAEGVPASPTLKKGRPLGTRLIHTLGATGHTVVADIDETLREALAPYTVAPHVDEQRRLLRIAPHIVILSRLLSISFLFSVFIIVAVVVALVVVVITADGDVAGALLGGALPVVLAFGSIALTQVRSTIQHCNFSVALTVDGLTITTGLATTVRRVVPLDRIQAVRLQQPVLWRKVGWWRVEYNFAGGADSQETKDIGNVLLPVGSLEQALILLGLALPEPGHAQAGRLLRQAMQSDNADAQSQELGLYPVPRAARWLDPLTAGRSAWAQTDTMLVIRQGRITREVDCVPHARVQSIARTQGPLQRRLGLATLGVHSTEGPIKPRLHHIDAGLSAQLVFELAAVTMSARAGLDEVSAQRLR